MQDRISKGYFSWLCNLVCKGLYPDEISYAKLLKHLHSKLFTYTIPMDENRAKDGVNMRYRYAYDYLPANVTKAIYSYLDWPCTVLEMMVALAVNCEESIMDDPEYGDRTKQWFWGMVSNLGLGDMTDDNFDRTAADRIIKRFLDRDYEPDGRGGLFHIRGCEEDLRNVEIWHQLCWYLDAMIGL